MKLHNATSQKTMLQHWDSQISSFCLFSLYKDVWNIAVVEVLGFGATCIFRLVLMFQRNMLSPSSGDEVTRQGSRGAFIGPEANQREGTELDGGQ
jgi:hypothetical protein